MQWKLLGIYVASISLEACDSRLQIENVDDVRFTWYTFGGMDSWMDLALVVGVMIHVITFRSFFCSWHFSWYIIL